MPHPVPRVALSRANSSGRANFQLIALVLACGTLFGSLGWFFGSAPEQDLPSIEDGRNSAELARAAARISFREFRCGRTNLAIAPQIRSSKRRRSRARNAHGPGDQRANRRADRRRFR